MKSKSTCPKCGSVRIIRNVQVVDRSNSGTQSLSLHRGTRALGGWLKLPRSFPLDAWTCGACGYTELYVREPAELLAADEGASGGTVSELADCPRALESHRAIRHGRHSSLRC